MNKIIFLLMIIVSTIVSAELQYEFKGAPERYDETSFEYKDDSRIYTVSFNNMKVKIVGYNKELDEMENNIRCDGHGDSKSETCYVTVRNDKYDVKLTVVLDKVANTKKVELLSIKPKTSK